MKQWSDIPENEREHFMKCSVCENYFDMRDLGQVVDHQHWNNSTEASFSHSVKSGKSEVYIKRLEKIITLRPKTKLSRGPSQKQG